MMKLFKNILYVSEASVEQEKSIARAVSLAENNQADLAVIEVVPAIAAGIGMPPGGPISAAIDWAVEALDASGGEPVARVRASAHSFVLPEGRYRVAGRLGDKRGQGVIDVRRGEQTALGVVLD